MAAMNGPVHLKRVTLDTTIVCTKLAPWRRNMGGAEVLVLHPDSVERVKIGTYDGQEMIERRCPNCNYVWTREYRAAKNANTGERQ
jgi:hypothetical protein